jgi:UDP-N-acetyl-D-mannosaminuronic acid transferase (WecB/TagA/CpsF family)
MIQINIVMQGPGGVIDYEVNTIVQALKATGVDIVLDAPYCDLEEDWIKEKRDRKNIQVGVEVKSMPWGG